MNNSNDELFDEAIEDLCSRGLITLKIPEEYFIFSDKFYELLKGETKKHLSVHTKEPYENKNEIQFCIIITTILSTGPAKEYLLSHMSDIISVLLEKICPEYYQSLALLKYRES